MHAYTTYNIFFNNTLHLAYTAIQNNKRIKYYYKQC